MAGQRIDKCDIAIVGGGLAGGLAALALAAKRPDLDVRLVEPGPIGGNHIWSFFDSDIAKKDRWLVAPLVRHHRPRYDVRFPPHARRLRLGYKRTTAEALDRKTVVTGNRVPGRVVRGGRRSITK